MQSILLTAMKAEQWPVTFSIGVVTCNEEPENAKNVVNFADALMSSVKKSGKNRVVHSNFRQAALL